jgi:hypothetical protein
VGTLPWALEREQGLRYYRIQAVSGTGCLVGGSMGFDESTKGPVEPSNFFLM